MVVELRVHQRATITQPGVLVPFPVREDSDPSLTVETATPPEILLGSIPSPDLRLRAPIRLEAQREGDSVTVWSEELEEFGYGPHLTAAIEDFQQTVIELYHTLATEQGRLGPGMIDLWARLQLFFERRP